MGQKNKEKGCTSVPAWKMMGNSSSQSGIQPRWARQMKCWLSYLLTWLNHSSLAFCSANICPWDKVKKTVHDVPKSLKAETAAKISKCLVGWALQVRRLRCTHRC